jgi:hypothetical protein
MRVCDDLVDCLIDPQSRLRNVSPVSILHQFLRRMADLQLFLVRAGEWPGDDYDVHEGTNDGPEVGRIFRSEAMFPEGRPWFWGLNLFPAVPADHGFEVTCEAATAALKARWSERRIG